MPVRVWLIVAALFALLSAPAMAAPKDAVLNKEGYWGIDVDNGACVASMTLQGGAVFMLRAQDGRVSFGLFGSAPLPRGKAGRIETEAYGVDFRPSYGEDATTLYYDGELDARALAALRLARQVRILVDGRTAAAMTFEGTGFEGALDGVVACSKGEAGWWGKGVGPAATEPEPPLNKEGYWAIETMDDAGGCTAVATVEGGSAMVFIAFRGGLGFGVASPTDYRRGRKGRFETDAFGFDFRPHYDGKRYLTGDEFLDSASVFALRRAKAITIRVDGRLVMDMVVEGTGFAEVLTDVAACSDGKSGWWGEGARQP